MINDSIAAPERQLTIKLSDNRTLAWYEWGDSDGLPIIYCTGAAMSGRLGFGINHLRELGLRLLAIDRPGLGLSDNHPSKTISSWVLDIQEFIGVNQLENAGTVGFSQGAVYALALAAHRLVTAVAIVSGQDELAHPSMRNLLHPDVANMINAVEKDATGFEQYFTQIATPEVLWQLIINMSSPRDLDLYNSESFSQAYQQCLQAGFSQGAQGYARDLVNAISNWPFELEKIDIPIDLWYGREDTSTVHSPDFGVTLSKRLTNANLIIDDNEGGSILWTRARDVLIKLKSQGFN